MKLRQYIGILLLLITPVVAQAQIGLKPLHANPVIKKYLNDHPDYEWGAGALNKWGQPDTLQLPFFDDFSQTAIYPDSSKWLNNLVFISLDIPVRPPSYGAATFDFLDPEGNPYSPLEENRLSGADTLTSQYLDLEGLDAQDSVILTFFYQRRGLGDFLTAQDSLKLEFKVNDTTWTQVWSAGGGPFTEFIQVDLHVEDPRFFYDGFQFRFANRTYQWGNNNHWHVDYIYLDRFRSLDNPDFTDYTVQGRPTSLLKNYYSMPYDHFLEDVAGEASDSIFFNVGNRNANTIQAQVWYIEKHNGVELENTSSTANVANVPSRGGAQRRFEAYDFSTLTGDSIEITRNYYVKETGITNPFIFQRNDSISITQRFENYFAMDDGTAESSFGFNDLKNTTGNMAIRFKLNKPDTLRAISYFFTPNVEDVSRQQLTLKIWQSIGVDGAETIELWDSLIVLPDLFTEGYGPMVFFPEPIGLPEGEFYVGWEQEDNYNLSLGFDRNNGYRAKTSGPNPDIFFNVGSGWLQNTNSALDGAPMIRVYVGQEFQFVGTEEVSTERATLYPNPAADQLHIKGVEEFNYTIQDVQGRMVAMSERSVGGPISVRDLPNGVYFISIRTKNRVMNEKFVVQH